MSLMKDKKGLIMGVANERSIAWGISQKLAAAGADLDVIDVPYLDLEDLSGMIREAELVRDIGFSGKGCIHPKQISSINEVFTPDEETVANAKKIIKAFKDAETGLVVIDGKLIEKPVLRHMERVVAIANRVSEK